MASGNATQTQDFDFGIRLGIVFLAEAFGVSAAAVLGLLGYIAYSAVTIKKGALRHWSTVTHVHWYFLSLLVSELIQAIGGLLDIKWVIEARVTTGSYCTAQGVLKNMGDVGVALASLAIALHTFLILVFRWQPKPSPRVAIAVLACIWTFLILIQVVIFGSRKKKYYGDTGFWCWIEPAYAAERIGLEYGWMWFACLINLVLYTLLALVIRGYVVVDGIKFHVPRQEERVQLRSSMGSTAKDATGIAWRMLFYPAVYTITVIPIAIVRWAAYFHSVRVPFWATILSDFVFACSGLLNVLLFSLTRPTLVPKRARRSTQILITPLASHNASSPSGRSRSLHPSHEYFDHDEDFIHEPWAVAPRQSTVTPAPEHKRSILDLNFPEPIA